MRFNQELAFKLALIESQIWRASPRKRAICSHRLLVYVFAEVAIYLYNIYDNLSVNGNISALLVDQTEQSSLNLTVKSLEDPRFEPIVTAFAKRILVLQLQVDAVHVRKQAIHQSCKNRKFVPVNDNLFEKLALR